MRYLSEIWLRFSGLDTGLTKFVVRAAIRILAMADAFEMAVKVKA